MNMSEDITPRNSIGSLRVSKLQQLEKANAELSARSQKYERLCFQLQKDVETLKGQINQNQCSESFQTDEEELANEVGRFENHQQNIAESIVTTPNPTGEWQTVQKNKRHRESPNQSNANKKQATVNEYWLGKSNPASENQFAILDSQAMSSNLQTDANSNLLEHSKPPPIFVDKVGNIQPLMSLLSQCVPNQYEIKSLRNDQIKIMSKTHETYKVIVEELQKKDTEFHTYKPKNERGFKVILKNIHPTVDVEELKDELLKEGHEATNVWNIKNRYSKKPLPLFEITLSTKPNNKNIFSVTRLMNTIVKFEAPRPKKTIPQCANCQQYGHTKTYCRKKSVCIKCAGSHDSKSCVRKNWASEVKCALCEGNHPANYKGCNIYKQLFQKHFPTQRTNRERQAITSQAITEQSNLTAPASYSNAVTNSTNVQNIINQNPTLQSHSQHPQSQPTLQQQPICNPNVSNIKEMLTSLNALMQQMTSLILNVTAQLSQITI